MNSSRSGVQVGHLQNRDFDSSGRINMNYEGSRTYNGEQKPVFFMMYASYCGHCHKAKPAFAEAVKTHNQSSVFLCALQTDDPNPTIKMMMNRLQNALKRDGINFSGVPTYILYKNGRYIEYQGGRDTSSLLKFISNVSTASNFNEGLNMVKDIESMLRR